jgi:predicted Zn-dependent protease
VAGDAGALARAEIGAEPPPLRRQLADGELTATIRRIARRLGPPAHELCRDLAVAPCEWFVAASRSRQMNAGRASRRPRLDHRGIVEYARSDDEVAFVMAHELAHHAANHVEGTRDVPRRPAPRSAGCSRRRGGGRARPPARG